MPSMYEDLLGSPAPQKQNKKKRVGNWAVQGKPPPSGKLKGQDPALPPVLHSASGLSRSLPVASCSGLSCFAMALTRSFWFGGRVCTAVARCGFATQGVAGPGPLNREPDPDSDWEPEERALQEVERYRLLGGPSA